MLRRIRLIVQIVLLVIVAALLYIYLPQQDIVRIVGTEIARRDDSDATQTRTIDVRYIQAETESSSVRVYRNEDTGMSFPFYFKYGTDTLQATAQSLVSTRDEPIWVIVTHYGLRSEMLSMYPNAVGIREAEGPDQTLIPWFNIVFIAGLAALVFFVRRWFLRRFSRSS